MSWSRLILMDDILGVLRLFCVRYSVIVCLVAREGWSNWRVIFTHQTTERDSCCLIRSPVGITLKFFSKSVGRGHKMDTFCLISRSVVHKEISRFSVTFCNKDEPKSKRPKRHFFQVFRRAKKLFLRYFTIIIFNISIVD